MSQNPETSQSQSQNQNQKTENQKTSESGTNFDDLIAAKTEQETPKPKPKKRAYRKRKKPEPPPEVSPEAFQDLLTFGFDEYLAKRVGAAHWALTPEEKTRMASIMNRLTIKYAPAVGKYSLELEGLACLVMIVVPRVQIDMAIKKAKLEQMEKENGKQTE